MHFEAIILPPPPKFTIMIFFSFRILEITERLVKSRDPEELKYLWEEWRKASGQKVRDLYVTYVNLSNEAAVLNSK